MLLFLFRRSSNVLFHLKTCCEIPLIITQQLYDIQIMKTFLDLHVSGQQLQRITLITVGCCKFYKESNF